MVNLLAQMSSELPNVCFCKRWISLECFKSEFLLVDCIEPRNKLVFHCAVLYPSLVDEDKEASEFIDGIGLGTVHVMYTQ